MNKDELEKLVKVPETNGNSYRTSLSVEAAELLEHIRQERPELYEHVLAESKRRQEEQKLTSNTALENFTTEIDFSDIQKNLENKITMQDSEQTFFYVGSVTKLYYNFVDENVSGIVALTKSIHQLVKKRKWNILPPSITTVEAQKKKILWKAYACLSSYDNSPSSISLIEGREIQSDYRKGLMTNAQDKGYLLPASLLNAVFDPIDQKLLEIYNSYKEP